MDELFRHLNEALAWCTPDDELPEEINDNLMRAQAYIVSALKQIEQLAR